MWMLKHIHSVPGAICDFVGVPGAISATSTQSGVCMTSIHLSRGLFGTGVIH